MEIGEGLAFVFGFCAGMVFIGFITFVVMIFTDDPLSSSPRVEPSPDPWRP